MAELSNVKIFGGLGTILMLVGGLIPYAGPIAMILGLVLVLIAVKKISELSNDNDIFRNYLMSFILNIIAIIAIIVIMIVAFGAVGGFSWITSLETSQITDFESFWTNFGTLIGACIIALIVAWILSIISALYLRKCYNGIAEYTKVDLFKTTGTVYFIGAITTIILIGFFILIIAKIIEIIAYFSLPDDLSKREKSDIIQRKCPDCTREIPMDAVICPYCGKKFSD